MTHVTKVDNVQHARSEISMRIRQTEAISEQFKKSYSGYTENTGRQKVAVFALGFIALALVLFPPLIIRELFIIINYQSLQEMQTLGILALYAVCFYVLLFMLRIIVRLSRIAKIDEYISGVNSIKNSLTENLESVEGVITTLERDIQQKNVTIMPRENIDAEIDDYKRIAESYSKSDGNIMNGLVATAYWIATVLFGVAFVAITRSNVAPWLSEVFDTQLYEVFLIGYPIIALAIFIGLHIYLAKRFDSFGFGSFALSLFSGPIAIPAMLALSGIIVAAISLLMFAAAIGVLIIIISIIFSR